MPSFCDAHAGRGDKTLLRAERSQVTTSRRPLCSQLGRPDPAPRPRGSGVLLHQGEGGRTADLFLAGGFGLFVVGFWFWGFFFNGCLAAGTRSPLF